MWERRGTEPNLKREMVSVSVFTFRGCKVDISANCDKKCS